MRMFLYLNLMFCHGQNESGILFRERARERSNGNDDNDSNVVVDGEKMAREKIEIIKMKRTHMEGDTERQSARVRGSNKEWEYRNTELHKIFGTFYSTRPSVRVCVSVWVCLCGLGAMLKQFQNSGPMGEHMNRYTRQREILSRGIKPHTAFIARIFLA